MRVLVALTAGRWRHAMCTNWFDRCATRQLDDRLALWACIQVAGVTRVLLQDIQQDPCESWTEVVVGEASTDRGPVCQICFLDYCLCSGAAREEGLSSTRRTFPSGSHASDPTHLLVT